MSGAIKHDQEKTRLDLLSPLWLEGVGRVLTFGAKKYAAHNWRQGLKQSRLIGAALRHLTAFMGGEDFDPETGLGHLYHASCCLMFASEMWEMREDMDDRYKIWGDHDEARFDEDSGSPIVERGSGDGAQAGVSQPSLLPYPGPARAPEKTHPR